MQDRGSLSYFLGLEISSVPTGYTLPQVKYALTSLDYEVKLYTEDGVLLFNPKLYSQQFKSLIYLTVTLVLFF